MTDGLYTVLGNMAKLFGHGFQSRSVQGLQRPAYGASA